MKGRGVGREIKRDVSKRPLGISSRCWCNSGGGWSPGPGMHEEFRSNWEGANGQNKRRTLCHSKVILKGSRIVTCYLLGEGGRGRRRRRGRSGKTPARCFLGEVRRTPSEGLKLSLSPLPRGFIFSRCLPRPRSSPVWFRKSPRLSKRAPLAASVPGFPGPFLSHFQPQETQVSETLSSLGPQGLSSTLRAPPRRLPGGQFASCPAGSRGASSRASSGSAPSAAAPALGSINSPDGSARQPRPAVNRSWRDSGQ